MSVDVLVGFQKKIDFMDESAGQEPWVKGTVPRAISSRGYVEEGEKMRTKSILALLTAGMLFLGGCKYELPFTTEHRIPIDSIVLGLWEMVPDDKEKPDERERMVVLRYSDTEYLIHFPNTDEGMYYRGYPIKIGDVPCVQLQAIGTKDGPMAHSVKNLFDVASYEFTDGELVVKTLNDDLVKSSLADAEALKAAFLKHKEDKELFTNPGRFRRL